MPSDGSVDDEIKILEKRISDRRVALESSLHELQDTASVATQRVRARAAPPALFGGALVLGFVVARLVRNMRRPPPRPRYEWRRQVLGGLLSLAMPIVLRVAQRQAVPLIERALRAYTRRRDQACYREHP